MPEPRAVPRRISAGVILIDREGRVLMQHRDDDPAIMYPNHWGLTGGAGLPGETPEQTARREVLEETGLNLPRLEPFKAYYFAEAKGGARASTKKTADYEVYAFHAPCETPASEMLCGEGQELRFIAPDEIDDFDVAYNHRDVLRDFFASPAYIPYVRGDAFGPAAATPELVDEFVARVRAGDPWFEALADAIAAWDAPEEIVDGRRVRYLIGGEAFDWLALAQRLIAAAQDDIDGDEAEALLFSGTPPGAENRALTDDTLRALIGDAKHRAHLNYVYGVTVEEALQYTAELELAKERVNMNLRDPRFDEGNLDPVYERIYGRTRSSLLQEFRDAMGAPPVAGITLTELREFMYWLFKFRVANSEPARVASDTRKALAQLSVMEDAVRRRRTAAGVTPDPVF
jgi:8-oxo-dGTP pyrophosphatase MutT (NUDIX family)